MSGGNNFAPFWADKMSMETEKHIYLTVILPNCYSSEEVIRLHFAWRQYSLIHNQQYKKPIKSFVV